MLLRQTADQHIDVFQERFRAGVIAIAIFVERSVELAVLGLIAFPLARVVNDRGVRRSVCRVRVTGLS